MLRKRLLRKIDSYYLENYKRNAIVIPSGRFGIYIIAKTFFKPNDKVIISPITCKTVIYALLSANVIPIFVDINLSSGNIDVAAIPTDALAEAKGIVTTNLYGTPDNALEIRNLAEKYNLVMVEDCAQVIDSYVEGHKIGTIGDVALFSFKKYFNIPGGVICPQDKNIVNKIKRAVMRESYRAAVSKEMLGLGQLFIGEYLSTVKKLAKRSYNFFFSLIYGRRKFYNLANYITNEKEKDNPTIKYDGELGKSNPYYRRLPTLANIIAIEKSLNQEKQLVDSLLKRNQLLISECPLKFVKTDYNTKACHLVVPFLTDRRDIIKNRMINEKGIPTWYIYNPPLNKVLSSNLNLAFKIKIQRAEEWSNKILPINSKYSTEYLEIIRACL